MRGLPNIPYSAGEAKRSIVKFGGYQHNPGAQEGSVWEGENLSTDEYPLLSPRKPRYLLRSLTRPNGLLGREGLCWVDGDTFYDEGQAKGTVENSEKTFCCLGDRVLIFPDKLCYHKNTGMLESLEASWVGKATVGNGTYAGQYASRNSITTTGTPFPFRVGDAVKIDGCSQEKNNRTYVLREMSEDKKILRFYENTFTGGTFTGTLTLKREVPQLSFLCENENRVWGAHGNTIYASKLGDPFNWNVFDGLSTDSYAVDVGSPGEFTGCCSYLGYPVFFKEDHIYKVYGSKPSNFQVMASASLGVERGSEKSLAIAGEILFYLSRAGVVAYGGGSPEIISQPLGRARLQKGVGGSDGNKYYLSVDTGEGYSLFVYDTLQGLWQREDATQVKDFAWSGELYFVDSAGGLWLGGAPRTLPGEGLEEDYDSMVEFTDFTESDPDKKGTMKLQLRMELQPGTVVNVKIQYDSSGVWEQAAELTAERKRSFVLPLLPRRCDHYRLRLEARGDWRLHSLTREFYGGSEL